ncbi:MAG: carboxypeptidase-like regulatory domain-containing protein [Pyrinomonadaceae bacterium]
MVNRTSESQITIIEVFTATHRSLSRNACASAAAIFLLMALASTLSAQTFRGSILGTVTDPNGAVLPGATVTARNIGTAIERTTSSDEFGNYTIAELQTGTYEVRVEKSGFQGSTVFQSQARSRNCVSQ